MMVKHRETLKALQETLNDSFDKVIAMSENEDELLDHLAFLLGNIRIVDHFICNDVLDELIMNSEENNANRTGHEPH